MKKILITILLTLVICITGCKKTPVDENTITLPNLTGKSRFEI